MFAWDDYNTFSASESLVHWCTCFSCDDGIELFRFKIELFLSCYGASVLAWSFYRRPKESAASTGLVHFITHSRTDSHYPDKYLTRGPMARCMVTH